MPIFGLTSSVSLFQNKRECRLMKTPDTLSSGFVEKFRHLEENFMRRLNLARKFRKFPIQRELRGGGDCWGRWDMWGVEVGFCHIATVPPTPHFATLRRKLSPLSSFPAKYHRCILHQMKNAAKMVNAVEMLEPHWNALFLQELFKFNQVWHFHSLVSLKIIMKWMMMTFFVTCS